MNNKLLIKFCGLENGSYSFDYKIDGAFFEAYGNSELAKCDFDVKVNLLREETLMTLSVNISGEIESICDRCLDPLIIPINVSDTLFVKQAEGDPTDENVLFVTKADTQIDISKFIYDMVCVGIPFRKVHHVDENGESGCNKEQIALLEKMKEKKEMDPRWDALKKLK
ncbi:MAG: DUF177 domain-containing protein [Bacteroidales bacterium]|nr:DUF177 domain-containing protein [Bacteroidales bacterium]